MKNNTENMNEKFEVLKAVKHLLEQNIYKYSKKNTKVFDSFIIFIVDVMKNEHLLRLFDESKNFGNFSSKLDLYDFSYTFRNALRTLEKNTSKELDLWYYAQIVIGIDYSYIAKALETNQNHEWLITRNLDLKPGDNLLCFNRFNHSLRDLFVELLSLHFAEIVAQEITITLVKDSYFEDEDADYDLEFLNYVFKDTIKEVHTKNAKKEIKQSKYNKLILSDINLSDLVDKDVMNKEIVWANITSNQLVKELEKTNRKKLFSSSKVDYILKTKSSNTWIKLEKNLLDTFGYQWEGDDGKLKSQSIQFKEILNRPNVDLTTPRNYARILEDDFDVVNEAFDDSEQLENDIEKFDDSDTSIAMLYEVVEVIKRGVRYTADKLKSLHNEQGDYKYLTISGIEDNIISYDKLERITCNDDLLQYKAQKDDIILSAKGSTLKIAFVDSDSELLIVDGNLIIIRPDTTKVIPEYLYSYMISEEGIEEIEDTMTGDKNISINLDKLKNMFVTLKTNEEQKQIAGSFAKLMANIRKAKLEYQTSIEELKKLCK